jgi:Holliday junction resolvase-like predicted endonuclease
MEMIKEPERLYRLIEEYGRMHSLDGYTPHRRGQRLNGLIAEMLLCWGINAEANLRSHGEIDVAFELGSRHFIVEAKWEATRTDTGALSKLQKRLRQRLGGTVGMFVSMSGYTDEALEDLKEGEQLMVLCLTQDHLESMLSGFIPPEELIGKVVEKASRRGVGYVEILNLFDPPYISEMKPEFAHPPEISQLVIDSVPGFDAHTVISSLPFGQSGIAELAPARLLVTSNEGIFLADLKSKEVRPWLRILNCSRNPLVQSDGSVFVTRKSGVARIANGRFKIVAGGFPGNAFLSSSRNGIVWAFSNGSSHISGGDAPPRAVSIGDRLGLQSGWSLDHSVEAHAASYVNNATFLVCGSTIALISPSSRDELVSARENPLTNPGGLARLTDNKFIVACNDVELWEIDISTREFRKIAKLQLQGSVYELTVINEESGYLFCYYPAESGQTRGIIVRWQYSPLSVHAA